MARIKPHGETRPKASKRGLLRVPRAFRSISGRVVIAAVVLLACTYAAALLWRELRSHVAQAEPYVLTPDRIQITPPPPWIRADIKAEILRDGSLDGSASLLDDGLAQRIYTAAMLHPWVAHAKVRLTYPAQVTIDITYRRPVAMVRVPGGLLPVDAAGVVLPSSDFSTADTANYPCIAGIQGGPSGGQGIEWGDPKVYEAARIAEQLGPDWASMGLLEIVPGEQNGSAGEYEIVSKSGWKAIWGQPPGKETKTQSSTAEKLARLKQYALSKGTKESGEVVDLRTQTELAHQPKWSVDR